MTEAVLVVRDLVVAYRTRSSAGNEGGVVRAVDGVDLSVDAGEILALVGESGCGKTTIAQAVVRLVDADRGTITISGRDVTRLRGRALRRLRRGFQMVFQDPFESLDPRLTVGETVLEPLRVHGVGHSDAERRTLMLQALEQAGLRPPEAVALRHPDQLSGGQRQRVAIAATMVLRPALVVADEPVSMLDVSLRAGILRLMLDLRDSLGLAYLFITHDLSLAWMVADRIAVVYLGRIVEEGPAEAVISSPAHPYTRALVSVIPVPEAGLARERTVLRGETPDARAVPPGCRFHPRCPLYRELGEPARCRTDSPSLRPITEPVPAPVRRVACHFTATEMSDRSDLRHQIERPDQRSTNARP